VAYILSGIQEGFRVGYQGGDHRLGSAKKNMQSAEYNPQVVRDYLEAERKQGVLLGPFERSEIPSSPQLLWCHPQVEPSRKVEVDCGLSHPESRCVNDGVNCELCSLQYVRVEEVVWELLGLGLGAQMAKMDIRSAYRMVPVHPQHRFLLGMQWECQVYVDTALPFGL